MSLWSLRKVLQIMKPYKFCCRKYLTTTRNKTDANTLNCRNNQGRKHVTQQMATYITTNIIVHNKHIEDVFNH